MSVTYKELVKFVKDHPWLKKEVVSVYDNDEGISFEVDSIEGGELIIKDYDEECEDECCCEDCCEEDDECDEDCDCDECNEDEPDVIISPIIDCGSIENPIRPDFTVITPQNTRVNIVIED
jgi:hypothetical protein